MYWEENNTDEVKKIEDKIIDVSFRVDCNKISIDHAYDLFEAVRIISSFII